jgi:signal transduction histidine kinase
MVEQRSRFLLLEDNPFDAELIKRELANARLDAEITHVTNEEDFRQALAGGGFEAILSDYHLPGFDGMVALQVARAAAFDVPFIFVSGAIGEERAVEALQRGATDYIIKDRMSRLPSAVVRAVIEREQRRLRGEAEERFLLAARATRDVIWDWRINERTFWVSNVLGAEWGHVLHPDDVTVEWWRAHIHPADAERVFREIESAFDSGASHWLLDYRFRRGNGQYGHAQDRALILRDDRGHAVRAIGAVQDITARVEAERLLEQEQRVSSLGRLATVISHEFNNVLMGIQSFADVVRGRGDGDPQLARAAAHITAAVKRGRQITGDILRAANPGEPASEQVDLVSWLRAVTEDVAAILPPDISLRVDLPDAAARASIDPQQLHQVMMNLAINARDAMSAGGELRVALARRNGEATIRVADTGPGIPEEMLSRIFDPFFTTKKAGTGLGLAIAKQIVSRNGGRLAVESAEGRGTTFTLALPLTVGTLRAPTPTDERRDGARP